MACRRSSASSGPTRVWSARRWSTCVSCRRCPASPGSCKSPDWGAWRSLRVAGLSGYLLGACLLKLVFCCVRVSNHVLCSRVALLAPPAAGRSAGADLVRVSRLQRRHVDPRFARPVCLQRPVFQSLFLTLRSHGIGADAAGRTARNAAIFIFAPATVSIPSLAIPSLAILSLAAGCLDPADLSGRGRRHLGRWARACLLCSAIPAQA